MQLKPFKNEYDFTRHIAYEHHIVEWDQSTIINETYAFLRAQGLGDGPVRDTELVVNYQVIDGVGVYVARARRVNAQDNESSKAALTVLINGTSVSTSVTQ